MVITAKKGKSALMLMTSAKELIIVNARVYTNESSDAQGDPKVEPDHLSMSRLFGYISAFSIGLNGCQYDY